MNQRTGMLLAVLGIVVILAAWWFLLYKPALDEEASLEAEIVTVQQQQTELQAQIAARQEIRATAPEVEAELARYRSLIPEEPGLPALLRQLQQAADDSGLDLRAVSPGEPAAVELLPEVSQISVAIELEGSYFQAVDFLRRVEDPDIVARAVLFDAVDLSLGNPDEYPVLSILLTGRMFTTAPAEGAVPTVEPTDPGTPTDGATDGETNVDVDVDVTETPAASAAVQPAEVSS